MHIAVESMTETVMLRAQVPIPAHSVRIMAGPASEALDAVAALLLLLLDPLNIACSIMGNGETEGEGEGALTFTTTGSSVAGQRGVAQSAPPQPCPHVQVPVVSQVPRPEQKMMTESSGSTGSASSVA